MTEYTDEQLAAYAKRVRAEALREAADRIGELKPDEYGRISKGLAIYECRADAEEGK